MSKIEGLRLRKVYTVVPLTGMRLVGDYCFNIVLEIVEFKYKADTVIAGGYGDIELMKPQCAAKISESHRVSAFGL